MRRLRNQKGAKHQRRTQEHADRGHQLHVAGAGRADHVARHHEQQSYHQPEQRLERRHRAAAEDGQDLLEYGLLAALIAVVAIVSVARFGQTVYTVFWKTIQLALS